MEFTGFKDADFDAYLEEKWSSNMFNLERLQVRQKLDKLGQELSSDLLSSDGSLLTQEVSTEHPAVWNHRQVSNQTLFFSRNEHGRRELDTIIAKGRSIASLVSDPSPLRNHVFLSVTIDSSKLELSLKLHSGAKVDRENLRSKTKEFFQRERLLNLIKGLPPGFRTGVVNGTQLDTTELTDEKLIHLIEEHQNADNWFFVSHSIERKDPRLTNSEFVQIARELLTQLLPIMHYISWSRDNDHLSMSDTLREKATEKKSKGLAKNDQIRVIRGLFTGKTGVVQEIDAKGGIKVMLGNMMVKLNGEDVTRG
ncbi:MAG: hypothetical protein V1754_01710 [Pseudomonadota bacterium]